VNRRAFVTGLGAALAVPVVVGSSSEIVAPITATAITARWQTARGGTVNLNREGLVGPRTANVGMAAA